jgi:hypothetical protein
MIDPTGYDAVVNAAALVYAGRASVTQIKSKKYLAEESACDVRLEFSSEHRNRTSNVMEYRCRFAPIVNVFSSGDTPMKRASWTWLYELGKIGLHEARHFFVRVLA